MDVAIPLFPGLTVLDAVGPYEVLQRVPDVDPVFVGTATGEVRSEFGALGIVVDKTLDEVTEPGVVVVPGGVEDFVLAASNDPLVAWLKDVHAKPTTRWVTSVCTGALLLARAGLLDGLEATTHWASEKRLRKEAQQAGGHVTFVHERYKVQKDARIITSAGVSAGIDMALWLLGNLYGPVDAKAAQRMVEYDPQPPFDEGNDVTGEAAIHDRALEMFGELLAEAGIEA